MSTARNIPVYADWQGLDGPASIGCIHAAVVRGKEVFSFEYDPFWLEKGDPILLDPALHFLSGIQYPGESFGLFLDSAPDRWGRRLIQRREALRAKQENRAERRLLELDYLLEVHDAGRMGGLRFKTDPAGPFVSDEDELGAPPLKSLRELERAAVELDADDSDSAETRKWLHLLLAPGTSLGGARPKANVIDPQGNLWIAKFPSRNDEFNVGAWEMTAYRLAQVAGLNTSEARVERFSKEGGTFLTRRFDRNGRKRIHFASALNLLGYRDGAGAGTGVSYLELADLLSRIGERVTEDLEELWKRIVFSICIGNTDDHLRNHGFLLGEQGWRLSPVYDLNPQPWGDGLALNISETDNRLDLGLAAEVAGYFRVKSGRMEKLLHQICAAVSGWERTAREEGLPQSEIERMRPAFRGGLTMQSAASGRGVQGGSQKIDP
jgi:serine/threonine-protein kinase HipA